VKISKMDLLKRKVNFFQKRIKELIGRSQVDVLGHVLEEDQILIIDGPIFTITEEQAKSARKFYFGLILLLVVAMIWEWGLLTIKPLIFLGLFVFEMNRLHSTNFGIVKKILLGKLEINATPAITVTDLSSIFQTPVEEHRNSILGARIDTNPDFAQYMKIGDGKSNEIQQTLLEQTSE